MGEKKKEEEHKHQPEDAGDCGPEKVNETVEAFLCGFRGRRWLWPERKLNDYEKKATWSFQCELLTKLNWTSWLLVEAGVTTETLDSLSFWAEMVRITAQFSFSCQNRNQGS